VHAGGGHEGTQGGGDAAQNQKIAFCTWHGNTPCVRLKSRNYSIIIPQSVAVRKKMDSIYYIFIYKGKEKSIEKWRRGGFCAIYTINTAKIRENFYMQKKKKYVKVLMWRGE
jgi:hypothetical protein